MKGVMWCGVSAVCLSPCMMQPFSVQKASGHEKKERFGASCGFEKLCSRRYFFYHKREKIYDSLSRVGDAVVPSYDLNYGTQFFDVSYTDI